MESADQSTTDLVIKLLVTSDAGSSGGSGHLLRVWAIENSSQEDIHSQSGGF